MTFQETIISESKIKIANLYPQAKICSDKPDTGVKITNKSAFFVIRDCAQTTVQYLPLLCYGTMSDPIKTLSGKFTRSQVNDFVKDSATNIAAAQLLKTILQDANIAEPEVVIDVNDQSDNIYGAYGYNEGTKTSIKSTNQADLLCQIFNVKK